MNREQEDRFTAECRALQENRPDMTKAHFTFFPAITNPLAVRIGQALRDNTVVTTLNLPVEHMTLTGAGEIARFVAFSPSLESLCLFEGQTNNSREMTVAVVDRLLSAAAFHGKIRYLSIYSQFGALPFAMCLQANEQTLTYLDLPFRSIQGAMTTQRMRDDADIVANAVGSLTSLEELHLTRVFDQCFVARILSSLNDHPMLRTFSYDDAGDSIPVEVASAMRNLFLSTTPLENLYFTGFISAPSDPGLDTVLQAMQGHSTLRVLKINEVSAACVEMLRHNKSIEELSVHLHGLLQFASIMEALETNTTLEELTGYISELDDEHLFNEGCRRLAALLPLVQNLKTLVINGCDETARSISADFTRVFESNTSLTQVHFEDIAVDDDAEAATEFYTRRNEFKPMLAGTSKEEMLEIFSMNLLAHGEAGLSVVFETLRVRDDWYERAE